MPFMQRGKRTGAISPKQSDQALSASACTTTGRQAGMGSRFGSLTLAHPHFLQHAHHTGHAIPALGLAALGSVNFTGAGSAMRHG